jgi:hypothetical protein
LTFHAYCGIFQLNKLGELLVQQQVSLTKEEYLESRGAFIGKTYNHLFGAVVLFTLLEIGIFQSGLSASIAQFMFSLPWLAIIGAFMVVAYFATKVAHKGTLSQQYLGLGGYVVAQALLFVPMMYLAENTAPGAIGSAAGATILGFAGLTALAHTSKKDFSFLGVLIKWGFICALVLIVLSIFVGFSLGTMFSVGMVLLAGCAILYDTSKIMFEYPEDRYVGASLQLFASVALMFWYLLSLFTSRD